MRRGGRHNRRGAFLFVPSVDVVPNVDTLQLVPSCAMSNTQNNNGHSPKGGAISGKAQTSGPTPNGPIADQSASNATAGRVGPGNGNSKGGSGARPTAPVPLSDVTPLMGVNVSNSSRSHAAEHAARARALGKMDAAERQQILDLEALQSAKVRVLESIRTLKRGSYYQDRRARLVERLQALECELAQLDSEYENADAIIEQSQREIAALGVRIKMLKHAHEVARLLELTAEINNLKKGLG